MALKSQRTSPLSRRPRSRTSGQSVVEFALVFPVMLFLLVGIADFGRMYTTAVAIESATREASDFGAFQINHWDPANVSTTVAEMQKRACVAAAGSHLQDYATSDASNNTCSNPSFQCWLELGAASADCGSSGGWIAGTDCAASATEPPCTVHVRLEYDFRTILQLPLVPGTIHLVRDSKFRISDLAPPP